MDEQTLTRILVWAGVILGCLIGLGGTAWGFYASIKNTRGPRERASVIRTSLLWGVWAVLFGLGSWLLPSRYLYGRLPAYAVVLFLMMRYWNWRQAAIRAEASNPTT